MLSETLPGGVWGVVCDRYNVGPDSWAGFRKLLGAEKFPKAGKRTWRRGSSGAWQVIECAQVQLNGPKVASTSTTSSTLGSPCSPEGPENKTYKGMSPDLSYGKSE